MKRMTCFRNFRLGPKDTREASYRVRQNVLNALDRYDSESSGETTSLPRMSLSSIRCKLFSIRYPVFCTRYTQYTRLGGFLRELERNKNVKNVKGKMLSISNDRPLSCPPACRALPLAEQFISNSSVSPA